MLSSKRRAIPTSIRPNTDIYLARTTSVMFSHVTAYLDTTYAREQYTYHPFCFYRQVPFRVHNSTKNQVDDSALIYSDKLNNLHVGFIVAIIQLKATKEIKFIIDDAEIIGFDSFSHNGTQYMNDLFVNAVLPTPPKTISITYNSIKEKVSYRLEKNMNSFCEFYVFPNVLEST
jgi:hypothetical protein